MNNHAVEPPRIGRHVLLNGIRHHYVKIGEGRRPLVIVPGITSPAATWEFVARELAKFRDVYVLDVRGRGLSQGGKALTYGLDDYAADLFNLIMELKLDRPVILGHSMGARVAIRFSSKNSAILESVVLVDPPVSGPNRRKYPIPLEYYLESLDEVGKGLGYEGIKRKFGWTEEQVNDRMEWLPTCDSFAIAESHRSFHEESIHEDLQFISAKCLLLYAGHGETVLDADAVEISSNISNCQVRKFEDSGHMIPWDQFEEFVSVVSEFLGEKE